MSRAGRLVLLIRDETLRGIVAESQRLQLPPSEVLAGRLRRTLPEALAETARSQLGAVPDAATPPKLPSTASTKNTLTGYTVAGSIQPSDPTSGSHGNDTV
ncbi:MAG: hypothetical protein ACYDGN_16280 [Acidimicrobiales bacterium]